jgi:hypothetical protein
MAQLDAWLETLRAWRRTATDRVKLATSVLPGPGNRSVRPVDESEIRVRQTESRPSEPQPLQAQAKPPAAERLERGHPKR